MKKMHQEDQMNANERYFDILQDLLGTIRKTQGGAIERAAQAIAGSLARGGMLYTFGTGHGHLLALEIFYRAGGIVRVTPVLDERLMLHLSASESSRVERKDGIAEELMKKYSLKTGDVIIVISNSGRNTAPVVLAKLCRDRGIIVIALTNMAHSASVAPRNALNLHLYETADIVLDNCGVPGDAVVTGSGGRRIAPTSTVAGAAILQSIVARVEEISIQNNIQIDFFASANIDGGDAFNEVFLRKYVGLIPHL